MMRVRTLFTAAIVLAALTLLVSASPVGASQLLIGGALDIEGRLLTSLDEAELEQETGLTLTMSQFVGDVGFRASVEVQQQGMEWELNLREAYAELFTATTDYRIGRQLIPWGVMDGASPVDVLNPMDLQRPLAGSNRLEVEAVRARHFAGDWELDGVWVPQFRGHRLPEPLPNHELPEASLTNGEVGLRVARWFPGMDAAAVYVRGWDREPLMSVDEATGEISFRHQRQQLFGLGLTKDFGSWIGRAEVAYILPEETGRKVDYAVGVDLNLPGDWFAIVQYNGRWVEDDDDLHRLGGSLQYQATPYLQIALSGAYILSDKSYLLNPELSWDAADGLQVTAGAYIIGGDDGTQMQRLGAEQKVYVGVSVAF